MCDLELTLNKLEHSYITVYTAWLKNSTSLVNVSMVLVILQIIFCVNSSTPIKNDDFMLYIKC